MNRQVEVSQKTKNAQPFLQTENDWARKLFILLSRIYLFIYYAGIALWCQTFLKTW